jgi:hypothetical protein
MNRRRPKRRKETIKFVQMLNVGTAATIVVAGLDQRGRVWYWCRRNDGSMTWVLTEFSDRCYFEFEDPSIAAAHDLGANEPA